MKTRSPQPAGACPDRAPPRSAWAHWERSPEQCRTWVPCGVSSLYLAVPLLCPEGVCWATCVPRIIQQHSVTFTDVILLNIHVPKHSFQRAQRGL